MSRLCRILQVAALSALALQATCRQASADSTGLAAVGSRPAGALDGKIVYIHGGHGYTASNDRNGAWGTQRPLLFGMVEDLGNKDQMDFFADSLFRAGATIVPLRPVGCQPLEIVIDNADSRVTYTGDWNIGKGSVYFGARSNDPYRFAATYARETATARFSPSFSEPGIYPVYAWTPSGSNRAPDQLYRIRHSGGVTEVKVNHRRVGNGLVYLGSYHFEAGSKGYVEVSNQSQDQKSVAIADMIRFGNGRGSIDRKGGVSGLNREDEAGLYWVMWHANRAQGIPVGEYRGTDVDRTATISLAPRYAEFMNRQQDGVPSDRVFVSFHSNAGAGRSRGVLGLLNGNNYASSRTPHQLLLARTLAKEINDDLVARAGEFEHEWHDRGDDVTLDRTDIEFGELNNKYIHGEFDATIIETGFHDNQLDAEMLRDPKVRAAIAQATCAGLIKYFHTIDSGQTPEVASPMRPTGLFARSTAAGSVTLTWDAPVASPATGDAAAGFVIESSTNGYGFDAGRIAAGGRTSTFTLTGLDPTQVYYFRIAALNRGGQSAPSEVVACLPAPRKRNALIVNGFDRIDRLQNPTELHRQGGRVDRVRPRQSNSCDYCVQVAEALHSEAPGVAIATASNEAVIDGKLDLASYDAVFWILGEESSKDHTFDPAEQTLVESYLGQGGKLFASGSDIAWELDQLNRGRQFCRDTLRMKLVADDADSYRVRGAPGAIFEGLDLSFSSGEVTYDVDSPDAIAPLNGAKAALTYGEGDRVAAMQFQAKHQRLVLLAFPFETIDDPLDRSEVMQRVVRFFQLNAQTLSKTQSPKHPVAKTQSPKPSR